MRLDFNSRAGIAAGGRAARVWDAQNGTQLAKLEGQGNHVLQAVFSPDAQLVATALSDMTLKIWEVQGEKQLKSMSNNSADAVFAFSPDNARLVKTYGTGCSAPCGDTSSRVRVQPHWPACRLTEAERRAGHRLAARWLVVRAVGSRARSAA